MRLLRHFVAVLLVVAVVVTAGIGWERADGASGTGTDRRTAKEAAPAHRRLFAGRAPGTLRGPGDLPPGASQAPGRSLVAGPEIQVRGGSPSLSIGDLAKTCVIEAIIMALVVAASRMRYKRRRRRRPRGPFPAAAE